MAIKHDKVRPVCLFLVLEMEYSKTGDNIIIWIYDRDKVWGGNNSYITLIDDLNRRYY